MPTPVYVPMVSLPSASGGSTPSKLKAWRNDDGSVDWDLWSLLPVMVPNRNWTGKHIRIQKVLTNDFLGWLEWDSELHGGSELRRSAKSARNRGEGTCARTHETPTVSTYGALTLFAWAVSHRRTRLNRERAEFMFRVFFESILSDFDDIEIDFGTFFETASAECEMAGDGLCCHLRPLKEEEFGGTLAEQAMALMSAAFRQVADCPAASSMIDDMARVIGAALDERVLRQTFPTDSILNAERRRGTKRHRAHDEDLRNLVAKRASQGQASIGSVMRAVGLCASNRSGADWHLRQLPPYLAAGWRHWQDCVVLSISADASKLGAPAEETMCYAATDGCSSSWLPPQVIRSWKRRKLNPGTKPTTDEKKGWEQKLQAYFRNFKEQATALKRRAKTGVPKMPNRLCALGFDNALMRGCGAGLKAFQVERPAILEKNRFRRYFVPRESLPENLCTADQKCRSCLEDLQTGQRSLELPAGVRRELHLMTDCGSVGFPFGLWLCTRGSVRGSFCSDVFAHDCHASVKAAAVTSGLWLVVLEVALCCNFLHGPFNADGNFQDVQSAAQDAFAHMTHEDELWRAFYMPISKDLLSWDMETAGSADHMEAIMSAAKCSPVHQTKGDRVKLSRWFSVWDRYTEKLERGWNILLLVLTFAGLTKGWFAVSEEFKLFAMRGGEAPQPANTSLHVGPGSESRSVALSSEVLNRLRSACENTSHVVAMILANTFSRRLFAGMNIFVQVTRTVHGRAMKKSKSPEDSMNYRIEVACGRWRSELVDICKVAADPAALSKVFLRADEVTQPMQWELDEDAKAAELILPFVVHLLGSRIVHCCCLSDSFPWKVSALLSERSEDLQAALLEMRDWWECLLRLDGEAADSLEAARFRKDLVWPMWVWPREVLVELRQCAFEKVPEGLRDRVIDYSRGWLTTKITEDGFRILRKKSKANDKQCLARRVRWQGLMMSDLFSEAHRPGIEVTPEDNDAAAGLDICDDLFSGKVDKCTISAGDLNSITDHQDEYPSMTPERFHAIGLRWMAYRMAGSFEALQRQWLSMLLVPGTLVTETNGTPALVLASCQYYAVGWRVQAMTGNGGRKLVSLVPPAVDFRSPFRLLQVSDLAEWKVLRLQGVAPRESQTFLGSASAFQLCGKRTGRMTIIEAAARSCFKGMTVAWLQKLHRHLGIAGAMPSAEADLCRALVAHALPNSTPEEVTELLKLRSSRDPNGIVASVLENEEAFAHAQEAMHEGDRDELKKAVDKQKVARGAATKRDRDIHETGPAASASSGAASSSAPPPSDRVRQLPKPCGDEHPDVEWARTLLPNIKGASIHRDDLWHGRWVGRYPVPTPPHSISRSWGEAKSSVSALREVLEWVWEHHTQATGEECPFRLGALPDIVPR